MLRMPATGRQRPTARAAGASAAELTDAELDAICRALQDSTRRSILAALAERELAAGELARVFPISRPAVSKHLRVLRDARLVSEHRDGRNRIYRLEPKPLAALDAWLAHYRTFWAARLGELKRLVESGPTERATPQKD